MGQNEVLDEEIDLLELFFVIKKHLWIVILAGVLSFGCVAIICKFFVTPMYTSETRIFIVGKQASLTNISLSDLQLGSQLAKDYVVLVESVPVLEQVIDELGLDMTTEQLDSIISVENLKDTRILSIKCKYSDPYIARTIVDRVAAVSTDTIAEIMDMNEPVVYQKGKVPSRKSSPATAKNSLIAGFIGACFAAAVIVVLHILNDTISGSEDVSKYLKLTVIGMIPEMSNVITDEGEIKNQSIFMTDED